MSTEPVNPFVGPRPLELNEGIYGRDEEIRELLWFFTAERIVWLHSPSGAGKTSLLQAGLIPKLETDDFEVLPPIRVNREGKAGGNRYEASMLSCLGATSSLSDFLDAGAQGKSRVLIFDQFEEILTLDPTDVEARRTFFETLGAALRRPDIWALFVVREDFLPALDSYARAIPTLMNNRFRLDLLSIDNARQAMQQVSLRGGRRFSPEALRSLAAELAQVRVQAPDGEEWKTGRAVEPVILQVVCRSMWEEIPSGDRTIEPRHVPTGDKVAKSLANYYAAGVKSVCGTTTEERAVRAWFGEKLIVSGLRNQVLVASRNGSGMGRDLADALVKTHLIRREERGDRIWYELAHDRLVEPVRSDNKRWTEENLHWVQRRTDLWRLQDRPVAILLVDQDLRSAERWIQESRPELTATENEFLSRSRDEQKVRDRIRRRTKFAWLAAGVATALLLVAVFFYLGARSRELMNQAHLEVRAGDDQSGCAVEHAEHSLAIANYLGADLRRGAMEALSEALQGGHGLYEVSRSGNVRLAFSPSARLLAVASSDQVRLYRKGGAPIQYKWTLDNDACSITRVALSGDGKQIAFGLTNGRTVRETIPASGSEGMIACGPVVPDTAAVEALAFSATGTLASAGSKGIEIDGRKPEGAQLDTVALAFRPDGALLATGRRDGTVRILPLNGAETGKLVFGAQPVTGLAWATNALAAVSRGAPTVRVWGNDGNLRLSEEAHPAGIAGVSLDPDGSLLATVGLGDDHQVRVWRLTSGAQVPILNLRVPPAKEADLDDVVFLDPSHLAVSDSSGTVRLFPLDVPALEDGARDFLSDHPCPKQR